MLESTHIGAMRRELEKLATQGHGAPPQEYEELNKPRLMQALKDVPIALLGTGLGYAAGRTGAEYLMPHIFQSPASHEMLKRNIGIASAATGGLGSYFLAQQHHKMKKRRDEADAAATAAAAPKKPEMGGTEPIVEKRQEMSPSDAPPLSKFSGAIVPAVAQARRIDPWREDRRYPKFLG